jgi:hypothetical protein
MIRDPHRLLATKCKANSRNRHLAKGTNPTRIRYALPQVCNIFRNKHLFSVKCIFGAVCGGAYVDVFSHFEFRLLVCLFWAFQLWARRRHEIRQEWFNLPWISTSATLHHIISLYHILPQSFVVGVALTRSWLGGCEPFGWQIWAWIWTCVKFDYWTTRERT